MKYILLFIFSFFYIVCTAQDQRYKWKYNTITHKLLQIEEGTLDLTKKESDKYFDQRYKLIDDIIEKCKINIGTLKENFVNDKAEAESILRTIDSTLHTNNFVVCIPFDKFSLGLTLREITIPKNNFLNCYYSYSNYPAYRKPFYKSIQLSYHMDCDLSSFIYLGVGEVLELPLKFVEVPNHNFVRWIFSDNSYFNWDTNEAKVKTDDNYFYKLSNHHKEKNFHYLQSFEPSEVLGYYYFVVGYNLKKDKKYSMARKYYEKAIDARPYFPVYYHYLAYMIVFTGYTQSARDFKYANELEQKAVELVPDNNDNYKQNIETLACSYALLGNHKKAVELIDSIKDGDKDLRNAFLKKDTGIEIYRNKNNVFDVKD